MIRITIDDPIFKGRFIVFVGDFEHVRRYVKSMDFDDGDVSDGCAAKTMKLTSGNWIQIVIWFNPEWSPATPKGHGVLAHEALHAAHWHLSHIGVSDEAVLGEVGNYYIEWLVREISSRLLAKSSKSKRRDKRLKRAA